MVFLETDNICSTEWNVSNNTTENIVDSNNLNLSGQTVTWNDSGNTNWYEQFIKILNASLAENEKFGNPVKSENIDAIPTNQYRINANSIDVPVYAFDKTVNGQNLPFEIV